MNSSTALLVLGMHRSGTSALARVCNLLGADLGDRLMPAKEDNERGFWEQEDVVVLHEALLRQICGLWRDVFPLAPDWLSHSAVPPFQEKLNTVLQELFSDTPLWGIKDPRLSLTFPAWEPVLASRGATPVALLALRHPLEVAASLNKRDGIEHSTGFAIWLHYTLMAELHSRSMPRAVVSYPDLLANWQSTLQTAADRIGITWPRAPQDAKTDIDAFLAPELRHHTAPPDDTLPPNVARLYHSLLASAKSGEIDTAAFDEVRTEWLSKPIFYLSGVVREERKWRVLAEDTATQQNEIIIRQNNIREDSERQYFALKQAHDSLAVALEQAEGIKLQLRQKEAELNALYNSRSWRITAPLRWVLGRMKKVAS